MLVSIVPSSFWDRKNERYHELAPGFATNRFQGCRCAGRNSSANLGARGVSLECCSLRRVREDNNNGSELIY